MKKILFLCGWFYPDSLGGTENYVCWLAKELGKKGFKVQIAAPATDERESSYMHEGIKIYRYPVSLRPSRQELKGAVPEKYVDVFKRWLRENKPDVAGMHSFTWGCGLSQAEIIKKMKIPLVFTAHMPDFICKRGTLMRWGKTPCDGKIKINRCAACYLQKRGLLRIFSWPVILIPQFIAEKFVKINSRWGTVLAIKSFIYQKKQSLKKFLKKTDHVICVSSWLYRLMFLNGANESKLSLCRHGLPIGAQYDKTQSYHKKGDFLTIGYLGRFNYVKGIHILIKAVRKIFPDIELKVKLYGSANSREEEKYLDKLKRIKKNDNRIIFSGKLPAKGQKKFFKEIDILAVPSLCLEAGPLVVLEAFSHGVPVVGSNLGGIAELVKDKKNGILVEPGNIKSWQKALQDIFYNPGLIDEMAKNTPKIKTIAEVREENLAVYEKILPQRQA